MRGERSLLWTYYTRMPQPDERAPKLLQQCGQKREVSTIHAREGHARCGFLAEQFLCREKGLPPKLKTGGVSVYRQIWDHPLRYEQIQGLVFKASLFVCA